MPFDGPANDTAVVLAKAEEYLDGGARWIARLLAQPRMFAGRYKYTQRSEPFCIKRRSWQAMPFDGDDIPEAAHVIDDLLAFFGDEGERWIRERQWDKLGNRCLWGALRSNKNSLKSRRLAERQIAAAIDQLFPPLAHNEPRDIIVHYNDKTAQCYHDIRYVLLVARADIMTSGSQFKLAI